MTRTEENAEFLESKPTRFDGRPDQCAIKIELEIYSVLMDISKSLAIIADGINKPEVLKICDNCTHDPNNKVDSIAYCSDCYDFSEWEAKDDGQRSKI